MVKIKIKSNPYHKKTEFKTWDDALDEWISIDVITCPNSPLLKNDFAVGFFPFKVKQIVDAIIGAYCVRGDRRRIS